MPKYFLFCCVIFLAFFEGIVCPFLNFSVPEFFAADMYDSVSVVWDDGKEMLDFIKVHASVSGFIHHYVLFSDIKPDTLKHEENDWNVVSFESKTLAKTNYNIYFRDISQANYFVETKTLPDECDIVGGRIYSHWYNVSIFYEELQTPTPVRDLGFKIIQDANNLQELAEPKCYFSRSDIEYAFKFLKLTELIIRNKNYKVDYYISFAKPHERNVFWGFFPKSQHNDEKTTDYFYMRPAHPSD